MNKLLNFFFFNLLEVVAVTRHDRTIPQVKLPNLEMDSLCAAAYVQYPSSAQPQAPQSNFNPTHKSVLKQSTVLCRVTRVVGVDVTSDTPRPYLCKAAPLTEERTPMVLIQSRLGHIKFPTGFRHTVEVLIMHNAGKGQFPMHY